MNGICGDMIPGPEGQWRLAGGATAGVGPSLGHPPRRARRIGGVRCGSLAPAGANVDRGLVYRGRRYAGPRLMSENPPGWLGNGGAQP